MESGLSLIAAYESSSGEDSSGDDDPGHRDKRAHAGKRQRLGGERKPEEAKKRLLPVPKTVLELFRDVEMRETPRDDPSLHQGRKRTFEHVRGNWATSVFIPLPVNHFAELQQLLLRDYGCSLSEPLLPVQACHLSLSRVVTIRYHWIEPFVAAIRERLSQTRPFLMSWDGFEAFVNEEGTRTFLAIKAVTKSTELASVVGHVDAVMGEFRLAKFYNPAVFHISLVWSLGDQRSNELTDVVERLNDNFHKVLSDCGVDVDIPVTEVSCKCGNKHFNVSLQQS